MTVIFFNGQLKNRKTRLDVPLPNIAILLDKIYYHVHLFFCAPKWEEAFLQVVCYLPFFFKFWVVQIAYHVSITRWVRNPLVDYAALL